MEKDKVYIYEPQHFSGVNFPTNKCDIWLQLIGQSDKPSELLLYSEGEFNSEMFLINFVDRYQKVLKHELNATKAGYCFKADGAIGDKLIFYVENENYQMEKIECSVTKELKEFFDALPKPEVQLEKVDKYFSCYRLSIPKQTLAA